MSDLDPVFLDVLEQDGRLREIALLAAARSDVLFDGYKSFKPHLKKPIPAFDTLGKQQKERYLLRCRRALESMIRAVKIEVNEMKRISNMMKEFHEGTGETDLPEAEIISYDRFAQAIAAKAAPEPPDSGEDWLSKLPVGTTFLTTKSSLRMEPELVKVTILNKTTGGSAYLMLDIPGNAATMNMYVNTYIYSKRYILMDTL